MSLPTFMTLIPPLVNELLGLRAKSTIMPVRELAFLAIFNGPPSGTDVNAAGNAHLLSRLPCV